MMLQTLSHSQMSLPYAPSCAANAALNMPTSLAILPQRRQPESAPAAQRPKLHLNTHQLRTFGKSSTSLRLDTLSAVSPTVRNTFTNAYEAPAPASAAPILALPRPAKPRLSIDSSLSNPQTSNTPPSSTTPSSASTLSSAVTSASSTESATISIPYKQPHNLTSILSNSPARHLLPRKMAPARRFFPAEKKVSWSTPLEEEIKTTKYTMAHFDMESSISSLETVSSIETTSSLDSDASAKSLSIPSSSPSPSSPSEQSSPSVQSSIESSPRVGGARTGEKRDSSESDSDSCPETPVAGRRKRRREWKWTLGSLDKSSSSVTSEITSDDDDDSS